MTVPRAGLRRPCAVHLLVLAAAGACSPTLEPHVQGDTVVVSVQGVAMAPGDTRQVVVTVQRREGEVLLSASGLPAGVAATFQPARLRATESRSVLLLVADQAAPLSSTTIFVRAAAPGVSPDLPAVPSAALSVRICPGYAIPTQCPPFETGGARSISGLVLERTPAGVRPLGGVSVWGWVQAAAFGYSRGRVQSAANGTFTITDLPDARILLQAWSAEYDQPCASMLELAGSNGTTVLELTPVTSPFEMAAPPLPALRGEVFEITPAGRRPVAGARLFFETGMEIVAATTTTDEHGRYTLCRLSVLDGVNVLTAMKSGYRTATVIPSVAGMQYLDLELRRD